MIEAFFPAILNPYPELTVYLCHRASVVVVAAVKEKERVLARARARVEEGTEEEEAGAGDGEPRGAADEN